LPSSLPFHGTKKMMKGDQYQEISLPVRVKLSGWVSMLLSFGELDC
jgi:hypothetical protein